METKRAIVLTVTDRIHYLKQSLDALKSIVNIDMELLVINVEPMNNTSGKIARKTIEDIDFMPCSVQVNPGILGLRNNTYDVCNRAFYSHGVDSIMYLEDDIVVSPDVLDLWDWYLKQDLTNIGVMSLYNIRVNGDSELICKTKAMSGWGMFITFAQYEKYAKPVWRNKPRMWDSNLAENIRKFDDVYNLMPMLSRVNNIGENGTHVDPITYSRLLLNHKYNLTKSKFDYKILKTPIEYKI